MRVIVADATSSVLNSTCAQYVMQWRSQKLNWGLASLFLHFLFFLSVSFFFFLLSLKLLNFSQVVWGTLWAGFNAELQPEYNLVHCCLKICDLVANFFRFFFPESFLFMFNQKLRMGHLGALPPLSCLRHWREDGLSVEQLAAAEQCVSSYGVQRATSSASAHAQSTCVAIDTAAGYCGSYSLIWAGADHSPQTHVGDIAADTWCRLVRAICP